MDPLDIEMVLALRLRQAIATGQDQNFGWLSERLLSRRRLAA